MLYITHQWLNRSQRMFVWGRQWGGWNVQTVISSTRQVCEPHREFFFGSCCQKLIQKEINEIKDTRQANNAMYVQYVACVFNKSAAKCADIQTIADNCCTIVWEWSIQQCEWFSTSAELQLDPESNGVFLLRVTTYYSRCYDVDLYELSAEVHESCWRFKVVVS